MSRTKKRKRYVYTLRKAELGEWVLSVGGALVPFCSVSDRKLAIKIAANELDNFWRECGQLSELQVLRADGTIGERRTYGRDPKRSRG